MTLFVQGRRYESFSVDEIVKKVKVTHMTWMNKISQELKLNTEANNAGTVTKKPQLHPTDLALRLVILRDFLTWLFLSFLTPLLRQSFFITESGAGRNSVFYFRQDVWYQVSKNVLRGLGARGYEEVNAVRSPF